MEQNKNTKMIWAIVIIAAIAIIGFLVMRDNKMKTTDTDNTNVVTEVEGVEDTTDPTTGKPAVSTTTGAGAVSLSYSQALAKYKNTRIQLGSDPSCGATPKNMTFKNGTTVMIDNRSPQARTFKLGSTYSIKAYGFRIVTLNSSTLPATWLLDCGTQQNVATILLQK